MSQSSNSQGMGVTWPPDLGEDRALAAGATIGENYQLIERIGVGGMGVVYRAQQTHPVRRVVAIKLIKLGIDTPQIVARFESERQALASLEHPGICRVYDAGSTSTGRPYFVMEHVAGRPINGFCDARRLDTRARLELFRQACAAVQHAHFNGILHRDLKPSNMLVTENTATDGAAQVKIIDFGIAKAMQANAGANDATMHATVVGQFVGTPAYTSPEQARGEEVDTRADIYSLGVMLYELLSGALPFEATKPATNRDDPPRPSARLSTIKLDEATKLAALRSADATSLRRTLRGDLDQIVLKAMHPDRTQRYESASAMSEDIRRYLAHEPILARPPTLAYEARKFARRNRVLVGAVVMVLFAIVAGGAAATVGLIRARQALAREAEARQVSQNVKQFLTDMISSVDPERAKGEKVLVRDVLDRAAADLPTRFQSQPVVAAELNLIIGQTYQTLGLDQIAVPHLERSITLRRANLEPDHPETMDAQYSYATALSDLGRMKEAEQIYRELLAKRREKSGPDHEATLKVESGLAMLLLELRRAAEGEPLQRHVLETRRRTLGEEAPETLNAMNNMVSIESSLGRHEEAEKLQRYVVETRLRKLGQDNPLTLLSQSNLSNSLMHLKRFDEAERILRDVVARQAKVSGPDHPDTLSATNNFGMALYFVGKHDECITVLTELAGRLRRTLPVGHPEAMSSIANLTQIIEERGRIDEAMALYKEMYESAQKSTMPPQFIAEYMAEYAFKLVQYGRYEQSVDILLAAKKQWEIANLRHRPKMQRLLKGLIEVSEKTGRAEDAAKYRDELARVVALAATMPAATQPGRR